MAHIPTLALKLSLKLSLLSFLALLISCGAHSPTVIDPAYKSIHIAVFDNRTLQYGLEERLTPAMRNAFMRDGRLRVAALNSADLELKGVIQAVDVAPVAFSDLDRAVGFNMSMLILVTVVDSKTGEVLMENRPFNAAGNFLLHTDLTHERTQDVAQILSDRVLSSLLEGW